MSPFRHCFKRFWTLWLNRYCSSARRTHREGARRLRAAIRRTHRPKWTQGTGLEAATRLSRLIGAGIPAIYVRMDSWWTAAERARKLRLPPVIRAYDFPLLYLVAWTPYIALYQVTNRWPLWTPVELPFTRLDEAIPFVPALLPVYVSYIALFFWTVARSENDRVANRVWYCTHVQLLISVVLFVAFPVRMPRELFYGAESYGWADTFWRWFDAPQNCFPSLHASNCLLFLELNWRRPYRWPHSVAALAVIASTVLVKQHYVVDLAGGAVVYLLSRAISARIDWEALPTGEPAPARDAAAALAEPALGVQPAPAPLLSSVERGS